MKKTKKMMAVLTATTMALTMMVPIEAGKRFIKNCRNKCSKGCGRENYEKHKIS